MDIEPTSPEGLEAPTISAPFPFHVKKGFGNVLPVGTRVQTFGWKDSQNVSFLDLQNGSKIDRFWSDFGSSKRYLKWTSKRNHFRVHFGVHFLGLSFPNRGPYIAYVSDSASLLVTPVPWQRSQKMVPKMDFEWTQKWTSLVSILGVLKWVPKWSILESIRSPFLGPFFGTLIFWWGVPKVLPVGTSMQCSDFLWAESDLFWGPKIDPF